MDYISPIRESTIQPGKPIIKKGTLDIGVVETTPVVWKGRLLRFEWIRNNKWAGYWNNHTNTGYYRFTDMETAETTPPFAMDYSFGCAHIEGDTAYVHGVKGQGGGNQIDMFWSKDLVHWQTKNVFTFPEDWSLFNTSVCKGGDGYVMAIEIRGDRQIFGQPFSMIFATSSNLLDWTLLPVERYIYTKDRYSACPVIRYVEGQYYIIYLESLPGHRWLPYIVRTADFEHYELGLKNPIMCCDDGDKVVQRPDKFSAEQLSFIRGAVDCNNSDIDLCEFNGKTVILYSWGNQLGKEFLAEAEYNGPLDEFLKSFF